MADRTTREVIADTLAGADLFVPRHMHLATEILAALAAEGLVLGHPNDQEEIVGVTDRSAGLDRYVVLRHGDDWQVVDLAPCSRQQPARFMGTGASDREAALIAKALNEANTGDLAERLDLAEVTIAELDELVIALHDADDPADADAADEILAECRARQEARA